jgi:hypothetical protein
MVLALALKAELNGVTDLRPLDTEDAPFYYTFKVQCTSCRETHPNWVSVSRFEQNEMSGSRGEANFAWKCKNCKVFLTAHRLSLLHVNIFTSVNTQRISRPRRPHMNEQTRPRRRTYSSSTAEDLNLSSSRQMYVPEWSRNTGEDITDG